MLSGIYKTHKIPYNRTIEKKPAGCRMHDRQSDGMQNSKGAQETGKGKAGPLACPGKALFPQGL